jgi:hypothetical protein
MNINKFLTTISHAGQEGRTQPLSREYSLSPTQSQMPDQSKKDEELFSALRVGAGAGKTELEALLRDGADVNAKNEVPVPINVSLPCGVMPNSL